MVTDRSSGAGEKKSVFGSVSRWCSSLSAAPLLLGGLFFVMLCYWELHMYQLANGGFTGLGVWSFVLAVPTAAVLTLLCVFFGSRVNRVIGLVLVCFLSVYYSVQLVYFQIFGSFLSMTMLGLGGDALTGFGESTMLYVSRNILRLLLNLLPIAAYVLLTGKFRLTEKQNVPTRVLTALLAVTLCVCCGQALQLGGTGSYSPYALYHSNNADIDNSASHLGVLAVSTTELRSMLFGAGGAQSALEVTDAGDIIGKDDKTVQEQPVSGSDTLSVDTSPNIIEAIDFAKLNEKVKSSKVKELNDYFSQLEGTSRNEYTGRFKGKNLIVLCAESFSPYLIDEQLTPALYRLANGGFIFKNFYNSFANVTTNGEYALCMGCFPDISRDKTDSSFILSAGHSLPFCLGNMFKGVGASTYAYHNYVGWYYKRSVTHPNMGYDLCRFSKDGMTFTTEFPTSDLEMFEQSVDDYISDEQFHAYYMTFSGHLHYSFNSNCMCQRNEEKVSGLDCPEAVRAYISCNLELEYAMEYLLERLEKAGRLEDTVIVLTTDHYPYGLEAENYNKLAGFEVDQTFEKYRNSFICWCGDMEEQPVVVEDYCCTVDILPTLLNLFGMKYDSRILAGQDVLSDCDHMAILSNQSFIDGNVKFNSRSAEAEWLIDTSAYTEQQLGEYLQARIATVQTRMGLSNRIVASDYYSYLEEEGWLG